MEQDFEPINKDNHPHPPEKSEEMEPQEIETNHPHNETIKEKEETKLKTDQLFESLQRLAADFENYKKRVSKEKQEIILTANARLILKILDIYEGLKKAIDAFPTEIDPNYLDGIKMLHDEFTSIMKKEGIEPIETVGKPFDVHKHEVLMQQVNDDLPEDTILEEIQPGYMLNARVLRHAKVVVSQKSPPPESES